MRDISSSSTYWLPAASYSRSPVPRALCNPVFIFVGAACTASTAQEARIMDAVEEYTLAVV